MLRPVLAATLLLTLAHCDSPKTPPKSSADRVAKAGTAMGLELDELPAARRP